MSPGRATGTLRWIVAALSAAWIATIVPAVPHAISEGYTLVVDLPVDWRDRWRIELHPSRGTPIDDAIRVWTLRNAATRQYAKVSASSRNPNAWLRLGGFPDLRIPVNDVLAPACPERSR
jgi:hypothetical protein